MSDISEFPEYMASIEKTSEDELTNVIDDLSLFITDLNKWQIFINSEQVTGEKLTSNNSTPGRYSLYTEFLNDGKNFTFKNQSKQKIAGERYFLLDTGEFFNSFRVETNDDGFKIQAQTRKPLVDLVDEYGDIIGLTDENFNVLTDKIFKDFCENIINYLEI